MASAAKINDDFYVKVERALRDLFEAARKKHELHFAMALMPEMRGMQDAGWNTATDSQHAFDEYISFLERQEEGRIWAGRGMHPVLNVLAKLRGKPKRLDRVK